MRGFNLFAAFLGVIMLAIGIGFSVYTFSEESQALRQISTQTEHYAAESIADLIRQDAHNTVVDSIRRGLQAFFADNDIDPPEDAWESEEKFKEWFSTDFIEKGQLTQYIADYIAEELLMYQGAPLKGHTVRVVVNREALGRVLSHVATVTFRDDGTFVFVYDSSKLKPGDLVALPSIVIDGQTTVSVFPPGKWMIPVPLRILEAYRHAKKFREKVRSSLDQFKILFGSCDLTSSPACGIYRWEGSGPVLVYPPEAKREIDVFASTVGEGTWRAYNLTSGACVDMRLYTDDSELNKILGVDEVSCAYPEPVLYALLQKRLDDLAGDDENAFLLPESIKGYRTWRIFSQQAISIAKLVGESTGIPYLDGLINSLLKAVPGAQIVPISPCRPAGYLYCAVPVSLTYTYVWVDKDTNFSVTGKKAVFRFRQSFTDPFDPIYLRYKTRDTIVRPIAPGSTEAKDVHFDEAECEKNMMRWCREQIWKGIDTCAKLKIQNSNWPDWAKSIAQAIMSLSTSFKEGCKLLGGFASSFPFCIDATVQEVYKYYLTADWDKIRSVGHMLYEEYNREGDRECAALFYAFKDENAICMNPSENFCEHLKWLENGVPGLCPYENFSKRKYVAYSYFWFHPFSEFAASCSAGFVPEMPGGGK